MIPWQTLATDQGFPGPRAWLEHLYVEKDMHLWEIALHVGCDYTTLRLYARKIGLPQKPRGGSPLRLRRSLGDRLAQIPDWRTLPLLVLCIRLEVPTAERSRVYAARKRLQKALDTRSTAL